MISTYINHAKSSAQKAKLSAKKFEREFRKQSLTAVTAAFGFLIALSWREPISDLVNLLIESSGLESQAIFYRFISALLITFIGVLAIISVTRWQVKEPKEQ